MILYNMSLGNQTQSNRSSEPDLFDEMSELITTDRTNCSKRTNRSSDSRVNRLTGCSKPRTHEWAQLTVWIDWSAIHFY